MRNRSQAYSGVQLKCTPFAFVTLFLFLASCGKTGFQNASEAKYVNDNEISCISSKEDQEKFGLKRAPGEKTYGYTWTTNWTVKDPIGAVKLVTDSTALVDPNVDPSTLRKPFNMGKGYYMGADPYISRDFGPWLLITTFIPGCDFGLTLDSVVVPTSTSGRLMNSLLAGVIYPWRNTSAIVVRNSTALDLTNIFVVNTRENISQRLWNLEPFVVTPETRWWSAAKHYGIYYRPLIDLWYKEVYDTSKFFDYANNITNEGLLAFLEYEWRAFNVAVEKEETIPEFLKSSEFQDACKGLPVGECLKFLTLDPLKIPVHSEAQSIYKAVMHVLDTLPENAPTFNSKAEVLSAIKIHVLANPQRQERITAYLKTLGLIDQVKKDHKVTDWKRLPK